MGFILDMLWRRHVRRSHHRKWYVTDQPKRIENGFGPDDLYPDGRSEADKERIGLKKPDTRGGCSDGRL